MVSDADRNTDSAADKWSANGEALTYRQFAKLHNLVTDDEVQGHIHGGLMAAHMPNSYHLRYQKRLRELQDARDDGRRQYREAIARGEIQAPPEPTMREKLEWRAAGDPDFPSTQAAIRLLAKLNAATGKPVEGTETAEEEGSSSI